MNKHKKQKPLLPCTKRMYREQRLQSAPRWVAEYEGSNIIRSYRKRYGVDWLCAITELQLLGVTLDPEYLAQLQRTVEVQEKQNRKMRLKRQQATLDEKCTERFPYSDGDYYFVAGYTSNGVPYGVTWEEASAQGLIGPEEEPKAPPDTIDW